MASGRMHKPGDIHMVTNRCEEGRFFLKPTKEVLDLIAYWFAKAKERYGHGLEIYAFCFLCNHFHLLCKDTSGQLAKFMEYFQGNVARAVNEHLGREQAHFWQGHYDDQIIRGERTFWKKYLYIITNAVKAGLVRRTAHWRGFCSFAAAVSGRPITGKGLNRTRYHSANRGVGKRKPRKEFMETFSFELTPPPGLENFSPKERGAEIRRMVRQSEEHYTERRGRKQALGMKKVMMVSSFFKPRRPERQPKRRFACDTREGLMELLEQYREFIARYKQTIAAFLAAAMRNFRGILGEWPTGSFPPSSCYPVMCDSET